MTDSIFAGVMPAITTPWRPDGAVDHEFLAQHARLMVDAGATGIVPLGSLGEGATLERTEKLTIIETLVRSVGSRVPVVPGISALSTASAVELAAQAQRIGCRGLMVLPPYVHKGPWGEMEEHFRAVFDSTDLPCMLYNNPIAYGVDVTPEAVVRLAARHANLRAVKESSGDVRRVTAILSLADGRLDVLAGLDDMIVEAVAMGAAGWVAGLVNALPRESMRLFDLARHGPGAARELYRWFLPLLRLDTVPEFVQLIKLAQQEVGLGNERVRSPRFVLSGTARDEALALIRTALRTRSRVMEGASS